MSKACSTALAQSEYSFSFPSLPGTQKSQMREHCILNSSAYLPIAAVATQLYSIISSTKEDRKLLVVMTMESRCRTCPVIRKILQSWHSLRTEREREQSRWRRGDSAVWNVPQTSNHKSAHLLSGCSISAVWATASAPLSKLPQKHMTFLQSSLGHIHGNARGMAHHLHPAQWISSGQSFSHFWERKTAGDISPSPFSPQNPLIMWHILNFSIRSFIQACWWNTSYILYSVTHSFIHIFNNVYRIAPIFDSVLLSFTYSTYLLTIYYTPTTVMCKSIQKWVRNSPCPKLTVNKDKDE